LCTELGARPPTEANYRSDELWYRCSDCVGGKGTLDVVTFGYQIYVGLLNLEQIVFGGKKDEKGVASLPIFCAIDIGVAWSTKKGEYKYVVNGVQEGVCSLFAFHRMPVQRAFVNAYKRGALDHIAPPKPGHL
jgi:hypothetical protein